MSFLKEFKEFAMRGNVMDLAVGVIIGAAFGKIVSSLVADVIMPPVGMLLGGVDFTSLKLTLAPPIEGMKGATLNYGNFIQALVDFIIVAFAIFLMVKGLNTLKRRMEAPAPDAPPPPVPADVALLTEIRDLLKAQKA
ncbi:large-conductance mechanosensitive channel protein MscL [Fundidesulfovibrio agrisoli]|uniref:large-conductance mechanosensitive channel protein MscL n=1 Tax=Fundidesulfovibrio agrisoli TaxID=2922717 RepID=UPI001FABF9AF|nr:large-conductance mechanosensitive channel protein MscL [Fundidesulfovibrio agrisoli]